MSNTAGIELLHTKTLAGLAQAEISRLIQVGELRAGEKLSEISLTDRLNVSRAAVREAFRALEEAGLVRLEKNRGAFVRKFDRSEAIEIFEMRAWLEAILNALRQRNPEEAAHAARRHALNGMSRYLESLAA